MPSSGDDEILPPARHIRHWRRLAAGREIGAPELDTALYIEGPDMIVHGGCDKDEAAASDDRTTQTRHALDEAAVGLAAAEKVARYRHAQLSAVRLAGDINAGNNDVTLDELLVTIKSEMVKLGPLIGLDPNQLLLLQGAENRSPVKANGSEPEAISLGCGTDN